MMNFKAGLSGMLQLWDGKRLRIDSQTEKAQTCIGTHLLNSH